MPGFGVTSGVGVLRSSGSRTKVQASLSTVPNISGGTTFEENDQLDLEVTITSDPDGEVADVLFQYRDSSGWHDIGLPIAAPGPYQRTWNIVAGTTAVVGRVRDASGKVLRSPAAAVALQLFALTKSGVAIRTKSGGRIKLKSP